MAQLKQIDGVKLIIRSNDHEPPHIHARYNGLESKYEIKTGNRYEGSELNNTDSKIKLWISKNRQTLLMIWNNIINSNGLNVKNLKSKLE
jgi:hypothetical protein